MIQFTCDAYCYQTLNLTFDGPFSDLSFNGGGLKVPPLFLFVKTQEKIIKLYTELKKKIFE